MAPSKPATLSAAEIALAQRVGFDRPVLQMLKDSQVSELRQLTVHGVNEETHFSIDVPAEGLTFQTERYTAVVLMRELRPKLQPAGYLIFLTESGIDGLATVAVARGADQYDILRLMKTEDVNGDLTTEDVIARLKKWENQYDFYILGANHDWVEGRFNSLPRSMKAFTKELINLAPDSIGQGDWASEQEFAKAMRQGRGFYLWWD